MKAAAFKGFGELRTPKDLLKKVKNDFERLRSSPSNEYAAFDFFVTAYHMLDWLHPTDSAARRKEEEGSPVLQVCSHLANGAKHFEARAAQHKSVQGVASEGKFFGGEFFGGEFFGELVIKLDGPAAAQLGSEVSAVDLAKIVLSHWESDARLS